MKKVISILTILILTSIFVPALVWAEDKAPVIDPNVVKLQNPLDPTGQYDKTGEKLNLLIVVGDITNAALGIIGSITLLVFAYGGFMWLTAAGNAEQVKKGSTAMMWAIIGLFIVFGSYVILETVIKGILGS